jgi:hypothetical protein
MMRGVVVVCAWLVGLTCVPGCALWRAAAGAGQAGGTLEIRSLEGTTVFNPALRTACYKMIDDTSADLYFSDLPADRLADPGDDLADAAGSILHIHYFLEPSPGNTPIDDTACNVTVRHIVIAPVSAAEERKGRARVVGEYGGGGFFFPVGVNGDEVFGGTMRNGTHRLIASTPGFKDVLGPASIGGKMLAARDDALADAVAARMAKLLREIDASRR